MGRIFFFQLTYTVLLLNNLIKYLRQFFPMCIDVAVIGLHTGHMFFYKAQHYVVLDETVIMHSAKYRQPGIFFT